MKKNKKEKVFMGLQLMPDWSETGTIEELEKQVGVNFSKGPGWYLTEGDSGLLVPYSSTSKPITKENCWHSKWPEDTTIFQFYVWNTTTDKLLLTAVPWGSIPTREMPDE